MPYFERDGWRMHYEIVERVASRDVLAIHGNAASNAWWEPTVAALRRGPGDHSGRWIAAEWRGCGGSAGLADGTELRFPLLADDYIALLRELGVAKAAVIGHSTGGMIALHALEAAPELFSHALLLSPVGADGVRFSPEMRERFRALGRSREFCLAAVLGAIHGRPDPELLRKIASDALKVHPLVWEKVPEMLHTLSFRPRLGSIPQPVLILHGEKDYLLPREASEEMARALPRGSYRELVGLGHSPNVESPSLVAAALHELLSA